MALYNTTGQGPSPSSLLPPLPPQAPFPSNVNIDKIFDKKHIGELAKSVDVNEQLDEDVEEFLSSYAEKFIEDLADSACLLALHRKANTLDTKDIQTTLERSNNIWIPGFASEELKPFKKAPVTEAHKQRMALIKKTIKKY